MTRADYIQLGFAALSALMAFTIGFITMLPDLPM